MSKDILIKIAFKLKKIGEEIRKNLGGGFHSGEKIN
jgi:hypothetical protein